MSNTDNQLSNQLLSATGSENSRVVISGDALDLKVTPLVHVKGRDLDKASFDLINGKFYFYFINNTIMEVNFPSLEDYGTGGIGKYGPDGKEGTNGYPGCDGNDGEKGCPGIPGFKGKEGDEGRKGDRGYLGAKGEQGLQGFPGLIGPIGEQGYPSLSDLCLSCTPDRAGPRGIRGPKGYDEDHHTFVRSCPPVIQNINTVWGRPIFECTEPTTCYLTTSSTPETTDGPGPYTTFDCSKTVTVTLTCPTTDTHTTTACPVLTCQTVTCYQCGTTQTLTTGTTNSTSTTTLTASENTTTTTLYCPECGTTTIHCPECGSTTIHCPECNTTKTVTTTTLCPECETTLCPGCDPTITTTTCNIKWGVCWGYGPSIAGVLDLDSFINQHLTNFLPDNDPVGFATDCSGSCYVHFAYPVRCVARFADSLSTLNGGFSGPTEVLRENCEGSIGLWYIHEALYPPGKREVIVTYPCTTTFGTFVTPTTATTRTRSTTTTLVTRGTTTLCTTTTHPTTTEEEYTTNTTTLVNLRIITDVVVVGEIPMPPDDGQILSSGLVIPNMAGWFIPNRYGYYHTAVSVGDNSVVLFGNKQLELPPSAVDYVETVTLTDRITGQTVEKEVLFQVSPSIGRVPVNIVTSEIEVGYPRETAINGQLFSEGGYPPYQFYTIVNGQNVSWYNFDSIGGRFMPTNTIIPDGTIDYFMYLTVKDSHNNFSKQKKVKFIVHPARLTTTITTMLSTIPILKIITATIYVGKRNSTAITAQLLTNIACPPGTIWGCATSKPWYSFDINHGKFLPTTTTISASQSSYDNHVWVNFPDGRFDSKFIECIVLPEDEELTNTSSTTLNELNLTTTEIIIGKVNESPRQEQLDTLGGNPPYVRYYPEVGMGNEKRWYTFSESEGKFIPKVGVIITQNDFIVFQNFYTVYCVKDSYGSVSCSVIKFKIIDKDVITTTLLPFSITNAHIYVGIAKEKSLSNQISTTGGIGPYSYSCEGNPPLLLDEKTGQFLGGAIIPEDLLSYHSPVTVRDLGTDRITSKNLLFVIDPPITSSSTMTSTIPSNKLIIHTDEIQVGVVGSEALSTSLVATGGIPDSSFNYRWKADLLGQSTPWYNVAIPDTGIYTASGSLIPEETTDYWITVTVTDLAGKSFEKDILCKVSIDDTAPLSIKTYKLFIGKTGFLAEKCTLLGSGGVPPYTWTYTDADFLSICPWFTFDSDNGTFTPTAVEIPNNADTYYQTMILTDSVGSHVDRVIAFNVVSLPLTIANRDIQIGNGGYPPDATGFRMVTKGGKLPYTFSIDVQKPWYTFNTSNSEFTAEDIILPYATKNYTVKVTVTDSFMDTATATLTCRIGIGKLNIATGTVLVGYTRELSLPLEMKGYGGVPPYTWKLNVTQPWYTFSEATGILTPTTLKIPMGTANYIGEVTATDSEGQVAVKNVTFRVVTTPPLSLESASYDIGFLGEAPNLASIVLITKGGVEPYIYTVDITKPWYDFSGDRWTSTGAIIPMTQENYYYTVTVKGKYEETATAIINCRVKIIPVVIGTDSIQVGTGSLFALTGSFTASGGIPPYTWEYPSMKNYYSLDTNTGILTPTTIKIPRTELDYSHNVRVTDSVGATIEKLIYFNVNSVANLELLVKSFTIGYVGEVPLLNTLVAQASGGLTPYTYTVSGNTAWYSYEDGKWTSTGAIIPLTQQNYTLDVTVNDSSGQTITTTFTFIVGVRPLVITTNSISVGRANQLAQADKFIASGGESPYTWEYGNIQPYYTLNTSTGDLTPTATKIPLNALSYSHSVAVIDRNATRVTKTINFNIVSVAALSLQPQTTVIGEAGVLPFTYSSAAYGGISPYTYSIDLQVAWYSYNTSNNTWTPNGTIIPKTQLNYNVNVTVSDTTGQTVTATFTFKVNPYYNLEIVNDVFVWGQVGKHVGCTSTAEYGYASDSFEIKASGGQLPYTFRFANVPSTLPHAIFPVNPVSIATPLIFDGGYCPPANAANWLAEYSEYVDYQVIDNGGHAKTKRIRSVILPVVSEIIWNPFNPNIRVKTNASNWYIGGGIYGTVENLKCLIFKPIISTCGLVGPIKDYLTMKCTGFPACFNYFVDGQVNLYVAGTIPTGTASFTITITLGVNQGYGQPIFPLLTQDFSINVSEGTGLLDMSVMEEVSELEIITKNVLVGKKGSFPKKVSLFARGGVPPYYWTSSEELPYYAFDHATGILNPSNIIPQNTENKKIIFSVSDNSGREEISEIEFKLI